MARPVHTTITATTPQAADGCSYRRKLFAASNTANTSVAMRNSAKARQGGTSNASIGSSRRPRGRVVGTVMGTRYGVLPQRVLQLYPLDVDEAQVAHWATK